MTTNAELLRAQATARESQAALQNVVAILDAITGGTERNAIFYEIGRATMTAKLAIQRETSK